VGADKEVFMKIVSVINHKGGVGKTTFTGSTAQALALVGFRVLAIDNDSQHNLSMMLGTGVMQPGIRDAYLALAREAPAVFLRSVRKTGVPGLHIVTSCSSLCNADISDTRALSQCLRECGLERYYDYILIDNAPGMDKLQASAIWASDDLFVPTELRQFAVDGLVELANVLEMQFPQAAKIAKVIPNFFRDTKRHNGFIAALKKLFPDKVTQTAIPLDPVFDEVITEGKILFLHRLSSKGAAFYLKLIHELFDLDEEKVWEMVVDKRNDRRKEEARQRFMERQRVKT
jgi:chromosome partitioning protein